MIVIWYNPDIDRYEEGMKADYVVTSSLSANNDRFEVLHEFDSSLTARKLATNIILNLNQIRCVDSTPQKLFV